MKIRQNLQQIISKLRGGKNGKSRGEILREKFYLDLRFVIRKLQKPIRVICFSANYDLRSQD